MKKILLGLLATLIILIAYIASRMYISEPNYNVTEYVNKDRTVIDSTFFTLNNNWLRKNNIGLWEMYVEGNPLELGVYEGKLSKELIYNQEESFADQIKQMIPSEGYLQFLKYFIGWFNRDIENHIIEPYKEEIYGVSLSTSDDFNFVADNYQRMLNYHGAHDIGHALKDLALVGCTSFVANQNRNDSTMVVGRNFDFYINDDFAKDKVIAFVSPDKGYKFAYITWASFIGVVSGMNTEGITVTINAAKSDIPTEAKTPISILAREILQFSSNIEEAIYIAKKREIFVSESILIASAKDDKSIIIEKSPTEMGLFYKEGNQLVSSNHFQSETFKSNLNNIENIATSASLYRQQRCEQLLDRVGDSVTVIDVSNILRDTKGLDDVEIGYGNEKAMNQLISHHSVIFLPKQLKIWVSIAPYQLGEYLCYDLNNIFSMKNIPQKNAILYMKNLSIAEDTLLNSKEYSDFKVYKKLKLIINKSIKRNVRLDDEKTIIDEFIVSNNDYFYSYEIAGNYFYNFGNLEISKKYYRQALTMKISNKWEENRIISNIEKINSETKE